MKFSFNFKTPIVILGIALGFSSGVANAITFMTPASAV